MAELWAVALGGVIATVSSVATGYLGNRGQVKLHDLQEKAALGRESRERDRTRERETAAHALEAMKLIRRLGDRGFVYEIADFEFRESDIDEVWLEISLVSDKAVRESMTTLLETLGRWRELTDSAREAALHAGIENSPDFDRALLGSLHRIAAAAARGDSMDEADVEFVEQLEVWLALF